MSFQAAINCTYSEVDRRRNAKAKILSFGIDFLDHAMVGILPTDLILIGAGSGAGKTELCCTIAAKNVSQGRKVHYIALEAEEFEIERRIKYNLFSKHFYRDPFRPKHTINFQNWMLGDYYETCQLYEAQAAKEFIEKFENLFIFYKGDKFDVKTMVYEVTMCAQDTDLIIIDHVHYFDYDDDKENKSIKEIAKTARTLSLEENKPIILVSHLRKRDRFATEICPGLEEFHGSSDLYKIATKAITIAPGGVAGPGEYETFIRIVKNRFSGGVTRYLAKCKYISGELRYDKHYEIGKANQTREGGFVSLEKFHYPDWAR